MHWLVTEHATCGLTHLRDCGNVRSYNSLPPRLLVRADQIEWQFWCKGSQHVHSGLRALANHGTCLQQNSAITVHQDRLFQAGFPLFSSVFLELAATYSADQRLSISKIQTSFLCLTRHTSTEHWSDLPPGRLKLRLYSTREIFFFFFFFFFLLLLYCALAAAQCIVGKGSDHLQLIKFWPSRDPEKGVCGGRKFLAPPYYSQRAVFASPLGAFQGSSRTGTHGNAVPVLFYTTGTSFPFFLGATR